MKKTEVIELIETLPDEIDPDDLIYRIYLKKKLDKAERELERGEVLSHEEVLRSIEEWLR